MPESEQTLKRLSRMEKDLSDIESMTRSLINFQGKGFKDEIVKRMRADDALRRVYLLVDGECSQTEIGEKLTGIAQRTVDRKLADLDAEGLITFVTRRNPGGRVYRHSTTGEALRIERDL